MASISTIGKICIATIVIRRASHCSSFQQMKSLGRLGLFRFRGPEISGMGQLKILLFAPSISLKIDLSLFQ